MKEIIREEKILSTLNCPYILKYNESFLHNEQMCIVTEYCEVFLSTVIINYYCKQIHLHPTVSGS